jgi:hypothetical protein
MQYRQDIDGAERELRLAIECDPQLAAARRFLDAILELKSQLTAGESVECGPGTGAGSGALYRAQTLGDGPDNRAGNGAGADGSARTRRKKGKKGKKGTKGR